MVWLQVAKSVISLLRYYSWKKFSIIYEESQYTVADALHKTAVKMNLTINHMEKYIDNHKCCEDSLPCCRSGYWYQVGYLIFYYFCLLLGGFLSDCPVSHAIISKVIGQ